MTQLRDMENLHHEKVSDIAVVTLEKLMKNELEEDLPDDLRMVRLLILYLCYITLMQEMSVTSSFRLFSRFFFFL